MGFYVSDFGKEAGGKVLQEMEEFFGLGVAVFRERSGEDCRGVEYV